MSKQFVVRSPRLDRAINAAIAPMTAIADTASSRRAGKVGQPLAMGGETNRPFYCWYDSNEELIKVNEGFVSRNGEFASSLPDSITPKTGYICVTTSLESGSWTEPACVISEPSETNYPIGYCDVSGDVVYVRAFFVTVAVFIVTEECR